MSTGGRGEGEGEAWLVKDAVKGHVELAVTCGRVEGGVTIQGPDRQTNSARENMMNWEVILVILMESGSRQEHLVGLQVTGVLTSKRYIREVTGWLCIYKALVTTWTTGLDTNSTR